MKKNEKNNICSALIPTPTTPTTTLSLVYPNFYDTLKNQISIKLESKKALENISTRNTKTNKKRNDFSTFDELQCFDIHFESINEMLENLCVNYIPHLVDSILKYYGKPHFIYTKTGIKKQIFSQLANDIMTDYDRKNNVYYQDIINDVQCFFIENIRKGNIFYDWHEKRLSYQNGISFIDYYRIINKSLQSIHRNDEKTKSFDAIVDTFGDIDVVINSRTNKFSDGYKNHYIMNNTAYDILAQLQLKYPKYANDFKRLFIMKIDYGMSFIDIDNSKKLSVTTKTLLSFIRQSENIKMFNDFMNDTTYKTELDSKIDKLEKTDICTLKRNAYHRIKLDMVSKIGINDYEYQLHLWKMFSIPKTSDNAILKHVYHNSVSIGYLTENKNAQKNDIPKNIDFICSSTGIQKNDRLTGNDFVSNKIINKKISPVGKKQFARKNSTISIVENNGYFETYVDGELTRKTPIYKSR